MIVAGCDWDVACFVAARSPHFKITREEKFVALGWADDRAGHLVAGVVFNDYTGRNIDMHVAGVGAWCQPHFFGECFRYPFEQLGVRRVTSRTPADNALALKFVTALGFSREGRVRAALEGDVDLIILGMLREHCRWLGVGKNGWKVQPACGA